MELVVIRHGESLWNAENRFTGWTDIALSKRGMLQAKTAGHILRANGFDFDLAFTSVLSRAITTLHLILEDMERLWIPEEKSWRLNERFYGDLQGTDKNLATTKYGKAQIEAWRRGIRDQPPPITRNDPRYPATDLRYKALNLEQLPLSESLADTLQRLLPLWEQTILPALNNKLKVLVVSHGNTLRALAGHLLKLGEKDLIGLEIPCGIPIVYDINADGFATKGIELS